MPDMSVVFYAGPRGTPNAKRALLTAYSLDIDAAVRAINEVRTRLLHRQTFGTRLEEKNCIPYFLDDLLLPTGNLLID